MTSASDRATRRRGHRRSRVRKLLMDGVGLDVLVEEVSHLVAETRPTDARGQPPARHRAGRFHRSEMPDRCSRQPPVQTQHRHRVASRKVTAGHLVHVGTVVRVEPSCAQGASEQRLVNALRLSVSVLVEQQLDQSSLDRGLEPGHHPGIGVGLLELVDALVYNSSPICSCDARRCTCSANAGASKDSVNANSRAAIPPALLFTASICGPSRPRKSASNCRSSSSRNADQSMGPTPRLRPPRRTSGSEARRAPTR